MENLDVWNSLKQPPKWALKEIRAGRLKGKSDINPQWRYQAMTEKFGMIGQGWNYYIKRVWQEEAPDNQIFAFAEIALSIKLNGEWLEPIPGIGGSMLVAKESGGLHANDEAYKMAITDALSVAMKMLGVGADVYMGLWDGSKYISRPDTNKPQGTQKSSKDKPYPFPDFLDLLQRIGKMKGQIVDLDSNDKAYYDALTIYGLEHANEFKTREAMIDFGKDLKSYIDKRLAESNG